MLQTPILILDLDNTIYPVKSIGSKLFESLLEILIKPEYAIPEKKLEEIKYDIQRIPFQKAAAKHQLSDELICEALEMLRDLTYNGEMHCFADYSAIKNLNCTRFLVTSGFTKLQESKIQNLGIAGDFKEIFIVDPDFTDKIKKDIFKEIIKKYNLNSEDILVIGDDAESEIQAANELNITSILIDPEKKYNDSTATHHANNLSECIPFIISATKIA